MRPRPTHANRLERWLGAEQTEQISREHRQWYGPPIAVAGVPGRVYVTRGGDFCGPIKGGFFGSLADYATEKLRRIDRNVRERQRSKMNTGFASLSDLISEATTGGKRQDVFISKANLLSTSGAAGSLWTATGFPPAGATPSARPGGSVPTNATVGSWLQTDPGGSDTLHLLTMQFQASTAPNTLLLYDRTFHAATINHNTTTSAQSVTGVPTRYATTTSPGVIAFLETTTLLGVTSANLTLEYTDQSGNAAESAPALALITSSSASGSRICHSPYFVPLNTVDTGIRTVTNITISALMGGGVSNLVQGKPLAMIPQPVANAMVVMDGINSAFNFVQILSGACLAFLELKGVSSTTTYTGTAVMCAG